MVFVNKFKILVSTALNEEKQSYFFKGNFNFSNLLNRKNNNNNNNI